jgi:Xaa-Pro aminopeptidase
MVMTYELFGGEWGVGAIQLEDTVVLTEDGIEPLSTCPAELPVV